MANTDIPWTSFLFIYFGVCEEEIQSGKRGSNSVIGASLFCWFSCSVTFSWLLPAFVFFFSCQLNQCSSLRRAIQASGCICIQGGMETNQILAFGILHQSKIFPIWAFTRKEKKNILLKKKVDAARIKRVMSVGMQKECGGMHRGRWCRFGLELSGFEDDSLIV